VTTWASSTSPACRRTSRSPSTTTWTSPSCSRSTRHDFHADHDPEKGGDISMPFYLLPRSYSEVTYLNHTESDTYFHSINWQIG